MGKIITLTTDFGQSDYDTGVLAGVIWVGFVLARALSGGLTQQKHEAVELVGLYWHFVDLVWIIIFTVVYLIQ